MLWIDEVRIDFGQLTTINPRVTGYNAATRMTQSKKIACLMSDGEGTSPFVSLSN